MKAMARIKVEILTESFRYEDAPLNPTTTAWISTPLSYTTRADIPVPLPYQCDIGLTAYVLIAVH